MLCLFFLVVRNSEKIPFSLCLSVPCSRIFLSDEIPTIFMSVCWPDYEDSKPMLNLNSTISVSDMK